MAGKSQNSIKNVTKPSPVQLLNSPRSSVGGSRPLGSLTKGLKMLLAMRDVYRPMSLAEITGETGLKKATAYRLLVTLERLRFLERVGADHKLKIGPNAFYVGSGYLLGEHREQILNVMRRIVNELRHTITLSVLDGVTTLFLDRLDGLDRVKVTVDIGSRVPAYASASGKAILAGLSDREIEQKFAGVAFRQFTRKTRVSIDALLRDVRAVRKLGFAINDEESERGLWVAAVPIKKQAGEHIAALAAAFPARSLVAGERERVVTVLREGAREIESFRLESRIEGSGREGGREINRRATIFMHGDRRDHK